MIAHDNKKARQMRALGVLCWWVNRPDSLFAFLDVLDQALTFTHLVRRQGVTLVSERVFPFLELDPDWRAHHVQGFTEVVHQVALVGIRQILDLVTVDHHDRRVVAPAWAYFSFTRRPRTSGG